MKNLFLLISIPLIVSLCGCTYFYDNDSDAASLIEVNDLQGCFYNSNEQKLTSYVRQKESDNYNAEYHSIGADYTLYECSSICFSGDSVTHIEDAYVQWNVVDSLYQGDDAHVFVHVNADKNNGHSLVNSYKAKIIEPTIDGFLEYNLRIKDYSLYKADQYSVSHVSNFEFEYDGENAKAVFGNSKIHMNGRVYSREKEGTCAQF